MAPHHRSAVSPNKRGFANRANSWSWKHNLFRFRLGRRATIPRQNNLQTLGEPAQVKAQKLAVIVPGAPGTRTNGILRLILRKYPGCDKNSFPRIALHKQVRQCWFWLTGFPNWEIKSTGNRKLVLSKSYKIHLRIYFMQFTFKQFLLHKNNRGVSSIEMPFVFVLISEKMGQNSAALVKKQSDTFLKEALRVYQKKGARNNMYCK